MKNVNKTICTHCYEKCTPIDRPTWIEVDLSAVRSNVKKIKKYICEGDKDVHLLAVVKANASGHGIIQIAEVSVSAGATWLGVATMDEAILLRMKLSEEVPILVFGYVSPEHLVIVSRLRITVTAISLEWVKEAAEIASKPFDFHLKLETGLNRFGCQTEEQVQQVIDIVARSPNLKFVGAYTHFATAEDVSDNSYFLKQLERFEEFLKIIPNRDGKIIHCANSCATLYYDEKPFYDMVRCGRALMGPPNENLKDYQAISLDSSISLRSTLIKVKKLEAGEKIGYGGQYTTKRPEWIGTVSLGYADGWHQQFEACDVLISGKRTRIVGGICMDHLMLRLPKYYPIGTAVTFIGQCGADRIVGDDIATLVSQPRSQVFANLSTNLPRIYFEDGKIVNVRNMLLNQKLLTN